MKYNKSKFLKRVRKELGEPFEEEAHNAYICASTACVLDAGFLPEPIRDDLGLWLERKFSRWWENDLFLKSLFLYMEELYPDATIEEGIASVVCEGAMIYIERRSAE